jgi:hypothetical protein
MKRRPQRSHCPVERRTSSRGIAQSPEEGGGGDEIALLAVSLVVLHFDSSLSL